jgi:SAM-dependent methyltransferase
VCDQAGARELRSVPQYRLYRCPHCDVGFSDPMRAADAAWYESSALYLNVKALHVPLGWHHERFLERVGAGAGRALLDIGCGTGAFLDRARSRGFVPAGFDFDRDDVRIARSRYGLDEVRESDIEAFATAAAGRQWDVVTLFEVIEHVEDPRALLGAVRRLTRPGGLVALSTPNRDRRLDALRDGDWPPNHLTRWSAAALRRLLEGQRFGVVSLDVKPFDADEIAAWLRARVRFGIARRMLARGAAQGDAARVDRAATLMGRKEAALRVVATPLAPAGRLLHWPGSGLLAVANVAPAVERSPADGPAAGG